MRSHKYQGACKLVWYSEKIYFPRMYSVKVWNRDETKARTAFDSAAVNEGGERSRSQVSDIVRDSFERQVYLALFSE